MEPIHEEATDEKTPSERLRELAKINPAIASLVASNSNAEPELLRELADSEEDFIRKNVAANPNTPKSVLWWLGEEFPAEVLENPVFPLLLLENPNLLEEIPSDTLMSFLKCPAVPISFMEWGAKIDWGYELRLCLAMNGQTPRTILEELVRSREKTAGNVVVDAVKLHVNYAGELKEDWQEEFRCQMTRSVTLLYQHYYWRNAGDRYFFPTLAAMGLVPEFVFDCLARHDKTDIRGLVAQSDRLPPNLLLKLGRDSAPEVRGSVARNQSAPPELLELLALDESLEVRSGVAENFNASPKVLEGLARDERKQVRVAVAKNPNAPAYLLEELGCDEGVFLAVASNQNTPKAVLEKLARYKLERNRDLKMILAANANTPVDILVKLYGDKERVVRDRLAGNPSTPKALLERFAGSKRDGTREALAGNPKIPKNAIHLLARDKSSRVRKLLGANPKTLLAVLLRLSRDKHGEVRRAVATNPKAPFSILEENISDLLQYKNVELKPLLLRYLREKPEGLPVLLELIVKEYSDLTRTIALLHPQMPPKVLAENGRSLVWLERCAIAGNPNTPKKTLLLHATDGNRIVRAAAKEAIDNYGTDKISSRSGSFCNSCFYTRHGKKLRFC